MKKGDQVLFYIGGQERGFFAGQSVLASGLYSPEPQRKIALSHGLDFYKADSGVDLTDVET